MNKILKIGSRGSPLALTQVEMVKAALAEKFPALQTETVIIKTSGDWNPADGETRLSTIDGGKGLFAKEIEKALLAGAIDCAVHSTKDMDSKTPDGLVLEHYLPRADARDVLLVSNAVKSGHDALPDDPRQGALMRQCWPWRGLFVWGLRRMLIMFLMKMICYQPLVRARFV